MQKKKNNEKAQDILLDIQYSINKDALSVLANNSNFYSHDPHKKHTVTHTNTDTHTHIHMRVCVCLCVSACVCMRVHTGTDI